MASTFLSPTVTNTITQPRDQLNLLSSISSGIPTSQATSQLPLLGMPPTQQISQVSTTSNSMMNIGQQDRQLQNVYQQPFSNHTPISTSVSVQNLSLPQDQSMANFQHSVSLDETLQNYNTTKVPENLKQILER